MTRVQEKNRRAAETRLSLSRLAEAPGLLEMTCLGLSSAREAQEKELAGKAWLWLPGGGECGSEQQGCW